MNNINTTSYHKLISFLKINDVSNEPSKAIVSFFTKAPNEYYLMSKVRHYSQLRAYFAFKTILYSVEVALMFGIYKAYPREVSNSDSQDSVNIVTIPKTKTYKKCIFTDIDDTAIAHLVLYRRYITLGPIDDLMIVFVAVHKKCKNNAI